MTKKRTVKKPTSNVKVQKISTAQKTMLLRDSVIDPELLAQMK